MTARALRRTAVAFSIAAFALEGCGGASSGAGAGGAPGVMTAAARATPAAPMMPAGVTLAMIAVGDSVYHANACARCHGPTAHGARNGPPLAKGDSAKWLHSNGSYEEIVATIKRGVPKDSLVDKTRPFQMNPRGSNPPISDESVNAVAAYIWKLNHP